MIKNAVSLADKNYFFKNFFLPAAEKQESICKFPKVSARRQNGEIISLNECVDDEKH